MADEVTAKLQAAIDSLAASQATPHGPLTALHSGHVLPSSAADANDTGQCEWSAAENL